MIRVCKLSVCVVAVVALAGCKEPASVEDLEQMCANLMHVRGQADNSSMEERTRAVEQDFASQKKRLEDWKEREMASWDEELEARLAALGDDEEKKTEKTDDEDDAETAESLKTSYEEKKRVGAEQFDKDIADLESKKAAALAAETQAFERRQREIEQITKDCVEAATTEGVSRDLAACRMAAPDADTYWNKCR